MGLSGKYNFKGIKEKGALGLKVLLAASPYTAWILKGGIVTDFILEFFANWLANSGLMIMNIGAIYVNGEIDQALLDRAMDAALKAVEQSGENLTPEQIKAIDDAVIEAARKAIPYSKST